MKHIITRAQCGKNGAFYTIQHYIHKQQSIVDCVYVDANLYDEMVYDVNWSFDGEKAWIDNPRWGRIYIKRLPDELQTLV